MVKLRGNISGQLTFLLITLACFAAAAVFGWQKLHSGFNFIDEGYHMTEAWRLTAGDHYFRDKFTGAINLSAFINSIFFRIYPDITLLGFRKLQFILTMLALILLSAALYRVDRQYWYQPFIFSIFAFTGLDPIGMISNLNYQSYPNLLITFHLTFLLLGLLQRSVLTRRILFIVSGFFLWSISFNLLHLSPVLISPVLIYLLLRRTNAGDAGRLSFSFADLCFVLAPALACWVVFVGVYNRDYIENVLYSVRLISLTTSHSTGRLIIMNWVGLSYIAVTAVYLSVCLYCLQRLRFVDFLVYAAAASVVMFYVIRTCFFGLIPPYYNGWFSSPMWLTALLISLYAVIAIYYACRIFAGRQLKKAEAAALILIIPCVIISIVSSIFSGMGMLTVVQSSIPAVGGIGLLILTHEKIAAKSYPIKLAVLAVFFVPFYVHTAWSDWRFTYYDLAPELQTVTLDKGFGKGIKTNPVYKNLYEWVGANADAFTKEGDYILSYHISSMVYMIAKRRPSLDESYIDTVDFPHSYYRTAVERMKQAGREPRMAFVFEGVPGFRPVSFEKKIYRWYNEIFTFPADDPISDYVSGNMTPVSTFNVSEKTKIRCFVDKSVVLEGLLKKHPDDPMLNISMGNWYKNRGDIAHALKYYKKVKDAEKHPLVLLSLHDAAVEYSENGEDGKALEILLHIVSIDPGRMDTYYEIASVYAKQQRVGDSVAWLEKAASRGFKDWNLLREDPDLDNIRQTEEYRRFLLKHAR